MPSFGGSLKIPQMRSSVGHPAVYAALSLVALGLATCAILFAGILEQKDEISSLGSGDGMDGQLAKMQNEVQEQLVEAAKRRALAKKHREQALELATSAKEDRMMAEILKRKSEYSHRKSSLKKDTVAVKAAETRVRKLKVEAAKLNAASDKDIAKVDQLKEDVLTLQDKAGTLSEKASEEDARVAVVKSAAAKEDASLPKLLKQAESTEEKASELKRAAKARMMDSSVKMEKATKLDGLAKEKEHEAHEIRSQLIGILTQKTATLAAKEKTAAAAEALAKREAAEAAKTAETYAEEASSKAALAHQASASADTDNSAQETATVMTESDTSAATPSADEEKSTRERLTHEATKVQRDLMEGRRRANLVRSALETERIRGSRRSAAASPAAAASKPAAAEAEASDSARFEGLDEKETPAAAAGVQQADPDAVRENEEGHMVLVKHVAGPSTEHMPEDGHYSEREEAFKRALAAAYRKGYENEDELSETSGTRREARKPARFEMLGPDGASRVWGTEGDAEAPAGAKELLQKGAGATVQLETERSDAAAAVQARSPLFTQLWYDPESLRSVTSDLQGTTQRLSRLAPGAAAAALSGGQEDSRPSVGGEEGGEVSAVRPARMQTLYEDGHQSRAEEEFNKEMVKYRAALEEQRRADLEKARRAGEELRNLPGGGGGGGEGEGGEATTQELAERRGEDLEKERGQVDNMMLGERRGVWGGGEGGREGGVVVEERRRGGGERQVEEARRRVEMRARREPVRVTEDDDGHLVIDDGSNGALDEFRDNDSGAGGEQLAGERRRAAGGGGGGGDGRVRRMEEELHESLSRENRLERRTERLEGEVEALTGRRPWRREQGRYTEYDDRRPRGGEEELRRRNDNGAAGGREDMLAERPEGGGGGGGGEAARGEEGAAAHRRLRAKAAAAAGDKNFKPDETFEKEYAFDPGHVSVGEIKFQHALKDFDHTKAILRAGAAADSRRFRLPELIPSHLPGQGL